MIKHYSYFEGQIGLYCVVTNKKFLKYRVIKTLLDFRHWILLLPFTFVCNRKEFQCLIWELIVVAVYDDRNTPYSNAEKKQPNFSTNHLNYAALVTSESWIFVSFSGKTVNSIALSDLNFLKCKSQCKQVAAPLYISSLLYVFSRYFHKLIIFEHVHST